MRGNSTAGFEIVGFATDTSWSMQSCKMHLIEVQQRMAHLVACLRWTQGGQILGASRGRAYLRCQGCAAQRLLNDKPTERTELKDVAEDARKASRLKTLKTLGRAQGKLV